jgi:hypothetical protein
MKPIGPQPRGLVDTEPLRSLLRSTLGSRNGEIPGIARNIATGILRALAISTVDYGTGQSVVWTQGEGARSWRKPQRLMELGEADAEAQREAIDGLLDGEPDTPWVPFR